MELKQVVYRMNREDFSISDCSRSTGLHPNTLYRMKNQVGRKPMPLSLKAVITYIRAQDRKAASNE